MNISEHLTTFDEQIIDKTYFEWINEDKVSKVRTITLKNAIDYYIDYKITENQSENLEVINSKQLKMNEQVQENFSFDQKIKINKDIKIKYKTPKIEFLLKVSKTIVKHNENAGFVRSWSVILALC